MTRRLTEFRFPPDGPHREILAASGCAARDRRARRIPPDGARARAERDRDPRLPLPHQRERHPHRGRRGVSPTSRSRSATRGPRTTSPSIGPRPTAPRRPAPTTFPPRGRRASRSPARRSQTISIPVNGDLLDEANETFTVNLTNPQPAATADITTPTGTGRINDNDPTPSLVIDDVSLPEGDSG